MKTECEISDDGLATIAGISLKESLLITGRSLRAYSFKESSTGSPAWKQSGSEETDHLCVSQDERSLASTSSCIIKLMDIASGRETRRLVDHTSDVTCVSSFSRSPYVWISGDDEGVCRVSDARRHPSTLLSLRQSRRVRCCQSSPDDSLLVIGDDSCLQLYDMRQRKLMSRFIHSTIGVAFHPGERLMASFGDEGVVRYWDLDSLECVSQSEPFHDHIIDAHFSHNGDSLLISSSSRIRSLSWEPCSLEWTHSLVPSVSLISSHLDRDDTMRVVVNEGGKTRMLAASLLQLQHKKEEEGMREAISDEEPDDLSPTLDSPTSPMLPSPSNDIVFLSTPTQEERSMRVVSHQSPFHSTPSLNKPSQGSLNRMTKATSRLTLDEEKKKEKRGGSVKRREEKNSSIDIMSMVDIEHARMMDELSGTINQMRGIKETFRRGNVTQIIDLCVRDRNQPVLASLIRQLSATSRWTLSLSSSILPLLSPLLISPHREMRSSALTALSAIVNSVGELVNTVLRNGIAGGIGVDIAAEDRFRWCKAIQQEMVLIQLRENDMARVMSEDETTQINAIISLFPL